MSLLAWILLGAIAGWLANLFVGSKSHGCAGNILVGMLGSVLGGALLVFLKTGNFQLTTAFTDFDLTSLVVATLGAVVLIGVLDIFRK